MRCVTIVIVFVLGALLSPLVAEMDLEDCRRSWNRMDNSNYEFFITQIRCCEKVGPVVFDGTFRVTVRDGSAVKSVPVHASEQPVNAKPELPGTIDDIYRIAAEARDDEGMSVEFQCHAAWHYPVFVYIRKKERWPETAVAWSVLVVLEPEPVGAID